MDTFDIITMDRHRLDTDGKGVTTLVILNGCPLQCRYCINEEILSRGKARKLTVDELMQLLMQDYCYFAATGGGVTFGGGEPLLHYESIMAFIRQVNGIFATTIETSLCLDVDVVALLKVSSQFIVDIKSINNIIYREYTGRNNEILLSNLEKISKAGLQQKCIIKIPDIKSYTTQKDIEYSADYARELGFENIGCFAYKVKGE